MGFYLRKSIKVGPVRFNLSKSGIGVSSGIKGFRVGTGPRGNYIHMGVGGVYYRKTLGGGGRAPKPTVQGLQDSQPLPIPYGDSAPPPLPQPVQMREIESADVSQMVHSSSAELLAELNQKQQLMRIGPLAFVATVVLLLSAIGLSWHPLVFLVLFLGGGTGTHLALRRDAIRKTTVLLYNFEPETEAAYGALHAAAKAMAQCAGCWHIAASGRSHDKRYTAGASQLVNRNPTTVRAELPPFLKTNVEVIAVGVGRQTLYLFPDRILVADNQRIGAVGYDELQISSAQTRFIEDSAQRDAHVVGQTWQFVNKNGSPDRRFSNNRQLPICLYDEITIGSRSGLNEVLQVSRLGVGQAFVSAVQRLAKHARYEPAPYRPMFDSRPRDGSLPIASSPGRLPDILP